MKLTILGCGAAGGVPTPGKLGWGACDPSNPRNRRRRASVLIEDKDQTILVDATPDCRDQLLDSNVSHLDAVLFTHAHADHCHGIDDLRWINITMQASIPAYGETLTLDWLTKRFDYVFTPLVQGARGYYKPVLEPRLIDGPFNIGDLDIVPFEQSHGRITTTGFRFGPMAYSTDVVALDDAAFDALDGVEIWVVDCLSRRPHGTHAHLDLVLDWIDRVRPKRAVLTHMTVSLDYEELKAELPPGVEPAFDGMVLEA